MMRTKAVGSGALRALTVVAGLLPCFATPDAVASWLWPPSGGNSWSGGPSGPVCAGTIVSSCASICDADTWSNGRPDGASVYVRAIITLSGPGGYQESWQDDGSGPAQEGAWADVDFSKRLCVPGTYTLSVEFLDVSPAGDPNFPVHYSPVHFTVDGPVVTLEEFRGGVCCPGCTFKVRMRLKNTGKCAETYAMTLSGSGTALRDNPFEMTLNSVTVPPWTEAEGPGIYEQDLEVPMRGDAPCGDSAQVRVRLRTMHAPDTCPDTELEGTATVTIGRPNLQVEGLSEEDETTVGTFVGKDGDLKAVTLNLCGLPTDCGHVTLSWSRWLECGEIRVWKEGEEPNSPLVAVPSGTMWRSAEMPPVLWIEGVQGGCNQRDVHLKLEWSSGAGVGVPGGEACDPAGCACEDVVAITVVGTDLSATDLFGVIPEMDEETLGAFVHFNVDNDDASDNSLGATKRPGGDYLQTGSVTGENDLKKLDMRLAPQTTIGLLKLEVGDNAKVWSSDVKGSGTLVLAGPGTKTWDMSDPADVSEFTALSYGAYVEGTGPGVTTVQLRFEYPGGTVVHDDVVKYTFISAECGDQPKTEGCYTPYYSERERFESLCPALSRCEWSIVNRVEPPFLYPPTPGAYNCIAWSVDETNTWYEWLFIDQFWGNRNGQLELDDMDVFYNDKKGWQWHNPTNSNPATAEVILFSGIHAARRCRCTCGNGKWIMYTSKCGELHVIEHVWNQVANGVYGVPVGFYY